MSLKDEKGLSQTVNSIKNINIIQNTYPPYYTNREQENSLSAKISLCKKAVPDRDSLQKTEAEKQIETMNQEAQKHFGQAREALFQALGHSAAAGASIEIPPLMIYEDIQAVDSWKEASKKYNEGIKLQDEAKELQQQNNNK